MTDEMVDYVHETVMGDRRLGISEKAKAAGISTERVRVILHAYLNMNKLCARWMPCLLTIDQKRTQSNISWTSLERFKRNPVGVLRGFVTVNETWVIHCTPETKQQSTRWAAKGKEPVPKKAKTWKYLGFERDNFHHLFRKGKKLRMDGTTLIYYKYWWLKSKLNVLYLKKEKSCFIKTMRRCCDSNEVKRIKIRILAPVLFTSA